MITKTKTFWLPVLALLALAACGSQEPENDGDGQAQNGTAVTVVTVETETVEQVERSLGTLRARSQPELAAEVSGRVVEVLVDEGQSVEAGQLLALIDPRDFELELRSAEAEVARLEAQVATQRREVDRQRQLRERGNVSQAALENAEVELTALSRQVDGARVQLSTAELNLERSSIEAPFDGQIDERMVSEGGYVQVGTTLFVMTRLDRLHVQMPFPEVLAEVIEPGQSVRLRAAGTNGEPVMGEVRSLRPVISAGNRAAIAIAEIDNPGGWRPGASVDAEVITDRRESIVVPSQAVVRRPGRTVVYLEDAGEAREREVTVGRRTPLWYEIREGLEPGDRVIVDGAGFLADGVSVSVDEQEDDPAPRDDAAEDGAANGQDGGA